MLLEPVARADRHSSLVETDRSARMRTNRPDHRSRRPLSLVVLAALLAAACGNSGDDKSSGSDKTTTTAASSAKATSLTGVPGVTDDAINFAVRHDLQTRSATACSTASRA